MSTESESTQQRRERAGALPAIDLAALERISRNRVAIFIDVPLWTMHFGTALELALRLRTSGSEVHFLTCSGILTNCPGNPAHRRIDCVRCMSVRDHGLAAAGIRSELVHSLEDFARLGEPVGTWPSCPGTLDGLRDLRYREALLGPAVVGTLADVLADSDPNLEVHSGLVAKLIESSVFVFDACHNALASLRIESLVVFNGRFVTSWAAAAAAVDVGVEVFAHESFPHDGRGTWPYGFELNEGRMVHEVSAIVGRLHSLENSWRERARPEDPDGSEFYFSQRYAQRGGRGTPNSFLALQISKVLPESWSASSRNIAVFLSSEFEMRALPGWENPLGESQIDILVAVLRSGLLDPSIKLWIRVHPNLAGRRNSQEAAIASVQHPQAVILAADSGVDSYALMEASEKVVTFGSTMGIEAVHWGVPSILAGRAVYESLGACYRPRSESELIEMINGTLDPRPNELANAFGLFSLRRGVPFEHFRMHAKHAGSVDGRAIRSSVLLRKVSKMFARVSLVYVRRRLTRARFRAKVIRGRLLRIVQLRARSGAREDDEAYRRRGVGL